jgi:epoxyqueuosine reductase
MDLYGEVRRLADAAGAGYTGVADLTPAGDAVLEQGGALLRPYPRCVSLGIVLTDDIVEQLPNRAERAVAVSYHHMYQVTNQRLDHLAARVAGLLQHEGFRAWPIPASERVDSDRICALFSHKLGAHLAGLGWIGKSCLLITPEHGPRLRLVSVLTDAPLEPTGAANDSDGCGECTACVDACPVGAFTGRAFDVREPREARYDARRCEDYFEHLRGSGAPPVCGLCVHACPFGQAAARGAL